VSKISVKDESYNVVADVEYHSILDHWDGSNCTSGSTGRHLGITKLKKLDSFVLIHGTQWQGEQDTAEIVTDEEALQAILRAGKEELLEFMSTDLLQ
jgi:hypothetical protein